MCERWPEHYNEIAINFKRRFENLSNDIYDRVQEYESNPNAIDIDPDNDEPDDGDVFGSDGEIPEY